MNRNELQDAISGINRDFISESDDFKAVSADFRKEKNRMKRTVIFMFCLAVMGAGLIGISKSGLLKGDLRTAENAYTTEQSDESSVTLPFAVIQTEPTAVSQNTIPDETLYYSKLVKNTQAPKLNGYDSSALALMDISAFDESMLQNACGIIEGEIIDLSTKQYEYATLSNKFAPNGRLNHKVSSVAYKIKIDRVFSGDFSVGDVVNVEDYNFICDSVISIKQGSHYVIPICKGDRAFYESDQIVSGATSLESCYYTLYKFHPQIERINGGYVVSSDWKTLITDECKSITMDIDKMEFPFSVAMYYVPENIFNDRIRLVIQN